jgi:hypothetical protein
MTLLLLYVANGTGVTRALQFAIIAFLAIGPKI